MMYAEVTQLSDRYSVGIYPDDLELEIIDLDSLTSELKELGYVVKTKIKISDDVHHFILDDRTINEKIYKGFGLRFDHHKVYEVMSVLDSGRSKDGQNFPAPDTDLAALSKQYNNVIVYQDKDYYAIWSNNKQTLDIMRKRVLDWRRNHAFRIERFV